MELHSVLLTQKHVYIPHRPKVHLASPIKIVKRGGGLAGLIDSGPLARQSRRTQGLGARQAGPDRACFSCSEIGTALNCPGRLSLPSLSFFITSRNWNRASLSPLISGFLYCDVFKLNWSRTFMGENRRFLLVASSPYNRVHYNSSTFHNRNKPVLSDSKLNAAISK